MFVYVCICMCVLKNNGSGPGNFREWQEAGKNPKTGMDRMATAKYSSGKITKGFDS